ncbi:hypothetical protein F5Y13DRAFT_174010 [Hypoxylon sp. FL1857]|nr:hypothetical protein F5Y13DRAFT_174010 [Hypoxylon sp. FL1857]
MKGQDTPLIITYYFIPFSLGQWPLDCYRAPDQRQPITTMANFANCTLRIHQRHQHRGLRLGSDDPNNNVPTNITVDNPSHSRRHYYYLLPRAGWKDHLDLHPELKTTWTDLELMPAVKAGKASQPFPSKIPIGYTIG